MVQWRHLQMQLSPIVGASVVSKRINISSRHIESQVEPLATCDAACRSNASYSGSIPTNDLRTLSPSPPAEVVRSVM